MREHFNIDQVVSVRLRLLRPVPHLKRTTSKKYWFWGSERIVWVNSYEVYTKENLAKNGYNGKVVVFIPLNDCVFYKPDVTFRFSDGLTKTVEFDTDQEASDYYERFIGSNGNFKDFASKQIK